MSQDIINEVSFFLGAVFMGIVITFCYDFLLILRRLMRHNGFFVSMEDFLFWVTCAVVVFYMLYRENNGVLRWFAVVGAAIGMVLYKMIIGKHFVHIVSGILMKQISLLRKIIGFILRPFRWMLHKMKKIILFFSRKSIKLMRYSKKKLTVFIKLIKMTLCKH